MKKIEERYKRNDIVVYYDPNVSPSDKKFNILLDELKD